VNTSGGLLSKGHPLGATGVAQIAEIVWQLRGKAGKRQVKNPKVGLAHLVGGAVTDIENGACTIHIIKK
jgi:acetyl-CoA acetyltransferase